MLVIIDWLPKFSCLLDTARYNTSFACFSNCLSEGAVGRGSVSLVLIPIKLSGGGESCVGLVVAVLAALLSSFVPLFDLSVIAGVASCVVLSLIKVLSSIEQVLLAALTAVQLRGPRTKSEEKKQKKIE